MTRRGIVMHKLLRITLILLAWVTLLTAQAGIVLVKADPHHPATFLAGTSAAELFRSSDGGDTWSPIVFPGALKANLHAILIDPSAPDTYLLAVSSETPQYAGVFRTEDGGDSWHQIPGLEKKQVWALAVWMGPARIIAAGAQDGVFLSRDGGASWARLSSPRSAWPQPVVSLAFDPRDENTIYAGTPHLVWKTSDGGGTWQRIQTGMREDSDIFSIEVNISRRRILFAGACSGLYRSFDGGVTWSNLERAVGGAFRTYVVARTPLHPNLVFAGTSSGLMHSADGGLTWQKISSEPVRSIAFDPTDPRRMFVATGRGILRTEDSRTFVEANEGLADR